MTLWNHDGVFFDVQSDDVDFKSVASEDVMSLSITEEMAKMDSGTLRLRDPNGVYSDLLRPGVKVKVSWGVRGKVQDVKRNPIEFMINSPSGGGDQSGLVTFDCSFAAIGFRGSDSVRWYESGTRAEVVAEVMDRMGILTTIIDFARGSEALSGGNKVSQCESDFKFLVRVADEWKAAFRVYIDQSGRAVAAFVDYDKVGRAAKVAVGESSTVLSYGFGNDPPNVKSYKWKDDSMNSSTGQGARVVIVDGKPQIYRTVVEDEKVKTYRLVPERIEAELSTRDLKGRTSLLLEYMSVKDFESVKRFFVEDTVTTAPQGSGLELDVDIIGDPLVTAGMVASFKSGFPSRIGASDRTWWIRRAVHSIEASGYSIGLNIVDAYSFSPTGVKIAPVGGTM